MGPLLFLILPSLVTCNIVITIGASTSQGSSSISARGSDDSIITDNERFSFGIPDEVLKKAIEKYSGGRPQDVFLHSPTPWNDLYKTYGWREVKRTLKPIRSHILDVRSDKEVVSLKEFVNNSTSSVNVDCSVMGYVENSITNKWSKTGILNVVDPIVYNVTGASAFSYSSPWGMDAIERKKVELGSSSDVAVDLDPGEVVSTSLIATKVSMTVQVDYTASLSGHLACNYPKRYNGHHFWRYDINEVMTAGGLMRTAYSSEVISVKFHTDASIVVINKKTRDKISEVSAVFSSE